MNVRKIISSLMAGALLLGLTACSPSAAEQETRPDNEIVTYEPLDPNKTLITLGRYTVFNDAPLKAALEEKFPPYPNSLGQRGGNEHGQGLR